MHTNSKSDSYAAAGVDVTAGYQVVDRIKPLVKSTYIDGVLGGIGDFGGQFAPNLTGMTRPILVSGTDGVGTKLKIAFLLDKHDTVGIDCVAMCVNDIICCGAKPQFFLPVHGEYKHLKKHAQTAAAVGIPEKNIYIGENGDCVVLSADGLTVGEPVPAGAVMVDGLGVGDVGNVVLRDRRHLSEDGLVIVVATIDARTGEVLAGPDLVSRGFVYVRESEKLLDDARDQVRDVLGRMSAADKRDFGSVKTRIRETVSAFLYRKTKRSPMILPILMEV